ncbi:bifunctional glutamate N-acetyltransferase/amino-acid acetyltransferase ArgJ [Halomonas sp. McH1-25]|uniref:bifunctional glutamate N-acetyltransferase/amino-acid acetyltransferase ArgJ n=1 Tax=unclassified Halomonas TaxID=2609666 RepID=UPI001EF528F5|nr:MULTISPECIES: bifunctional glutamate N-acetyltransferase/amino-acid acetyltransferase ArgJ [unclassified Halomonas]MCG7598947.1 bifunctional glutamate N-acetyltransferase/amino-acid acetyltransferase ArgJ [Halomonas sp. McH1-25]MCP1342449.1 bifunctional glutamate N-acetyltransferase/amino-acid acetyltransferase ArgJ [Halomonas sp. FL8]MCP1362031.1 bifunctional glutamate N-acetyltransferase/amino-acid acetyltransferase ArgJ [Halomonas sp. BBD45]
MAVGQAYFPEMPVIEGVRLGSAKAGIKKPGRRDLVIVEIAEGSRVAGTFTRNAFRAAPVHVAQRHLAHGDIRYLLINTGNANAGTGESGMRDAEACCQALGELVKAPAEAVLPFSTGVIGEPLPVERLRAGLPEALASLDASGEAWRLAAEGILTTDTRAKGATATCDIDGQVVTIGGISKGSGMIKPNMATMLGFVATDADIDQALLESLLRESVDRSFNCITVDSDTSTNDACMLIATGRSARVASDAAIAAFRAALDRVLIELAQAIIRDGEGATKFITLEVGEARSRQEALDVAFTVAHSPLVKTALYASDANWGRILAAVGRAPVEDFDVERVVIDLGDVRLVERGGRAASYSEQAGSAVMAQDEITIRIRLGRGDSTATVWTSDLSHEYVSINADYRS